MIAIEFTAKNLQITEIHQSGQKITVRKCVTVPIEIGLIRNGYIDSVKSLAEVLRTVLFEEGIKEKKVAYTLDSTAIKTKRVEVPYGTREHVLQFMEKQMGEIIADEEHMLDYIVHNIRLEKKKKYIDATLYAIPKATIQRYIDLAKELKLTVCKISILNDAIAKQMEGISLVKKETKKKGKGEVSEPVAVIPKKIWAGIYYERLKIFTRGGDGNLMNRTVMLGFDASTATEGEEVDRALITRYVTEIRKHIMMQESNGDGAGVEEIVLFGEHPLLKHIAELVGQTTKVETRCINKPRYIKGVTAEEYARYAGAIGSVVRR